MSASSLPPSPAVPLPAPSSGCVGCWAAGYCAFYVPGSTRMPRGCPLAPRPSPRQRALARAWAEAT